VLNLCAHWVSQNLSVHDRCQWVASSQELLSSYTSDEELFCCYLVTGDKTDLPRGLTKQMRSHAVEGRGLPHIYINL